MSIINAPNFKTPFEGTLSRVHTHAVGRALNPRDAYPRTLTLGTITLNKN